MIDDDDSIYHRIFSHPEMVADLLRNFLVLDVLAELDLSQMRRMNTKFTARTGQRPDRHIFSDTASGQSCIGPGRQS